MGKDVEAGTEGETKGAVLRDRGRSAACSMHETTHFWSETVTTMESMPRKVVRFGDCSKVNASVVRRSSTRPMISMGCIDELIWEVTDTTGVLVETDILTIAVESLDVLIDRPRAAQKMDEHCGRFARVG